MLRNDVETYLEDILPKFHCAFRKGFSTQLCLLAVIKTVKK